MWHTHYLNHKNMSCTLNVFPFGKSKKLGFNNCVLSSTQNNKSFKEHNSTQFQKVIKMLESMYCQSFPVRVCVCVSLSQSFTLQCCNSAHSLIHSCLSCMHHAGKTCLHQAGDTEKHKHTQMDNSADKLIFKHLWDLSTGVKLLQ